MLSLNEIPVFSGVSESGLRFLERSANLRHFPPGSMICRKGELGSGFFAIAAGAVQVLLNLEETDRVMSIHLGESQIFGEMSVITGMPVSANVVSMDSYVYVIPSHDFLELLQTEQELQKALMRKLVDRIHHRSSISKDQYVPKCTLIVFPSGIDSKGLREGLCKAISHYAPGSHFVDQIYGQTVRKERRERIAQPFPSFFPSAGASVCVLEVQGDIPIWLVGQDTEWLRRLVTNWRKSGSAEQLLVLLLTENTAAQLRDSLISGDTVVAYADTGLNQEPNQSFMHYFGLAEYCSIWPKSDDRYGKQIRQGNWCFQIDAVELERVVNPALSWDRTTYPTIDWIARWITHREIGIVLGAGAARGFAHLGVLQVLEEEGIPIDYACGTSMGGAVATIYGKTGNAADTIQIIRSLIGSNNKIRDLSWCPKSSLMAGKKLERAIIRATGGSTFAELQKPAAVLASDLVRRERFVFERGSTAMALLATTAIPGIFPPVVFGNRILVDGALLSRVPMDLLDRRRCGLKMAVNVVPSSDLTANLDALHCQRIKHQLDKFFGFRHVITKAWEILAWWQGASEAEAADILIEPRTDPHAGYDFDAVNELIEAGREAARKKLGGIRRSLDSLLKPGVP